MKRRVNQIALAAACALLWVSAASGEPPPEDGSGRWVPALGITGGVTFQNQEASVESLELSPAGAVVGPLRDAVSDTDWAVSPYVGAQLQLMTPALPIPGRPRFFVSGEILPTFAPDRDIAKEGDPSGFSLPPQFSEDEPTLFPASAYGGVGSRTTATIDTLVWGANAGIVIPFTIRERQLRLKPSFGWLQYSVDVEGLVLQALKDDPPTFPFGPNIRKVSLSGSDSKTYNGIGPGLELELDAARWRWLGISVYADAHAYKLLGKREVSFSDSESFPQMGGLPAATYQADWSFEPKPWMFRAGVGIRMHWLGSPR